MEDLTQQPPGVEATPDIQPDPSLGAQNDPIVIGFQDRLKGLYAAANSGGMPQETYDIRLKAQLRKHLNDAPGLQSELMSVYSRYTMTDDYARIKQMEAAQTAAAKAASSNAQNQIKDIEKYGTSNFGMMPGWTQDPNKIQYVAAQEGLLATSKRGSLELNVLQNADASQDLLREAASRSTASEVGQMLLEMQNPDNPYTIPVPMGDGTAVAVNPLSVEVRNLDENQKNLLEDQLLAQKAQMRSMIQTQVASGGLDQTTMQPSLDAIDTYFDAALAMLQEEGRASRASQTVSQMQPEITREDRTWNRQYREQQQGGWELENLQRELQTQTTTQDIAFLSTRYLDLYQKQTIALEGNYILMNNPDAKKLIALQSLGLDTSNPAFKAMNMRLNNGYLQAPRRTFEDPQKWNTHLENLQKHYGNLQVDIISAPAAQAAVEHLNGLVQGMMDIGADMTFDEQVKTMKILSTSGVAGLAEKYPELAASVGDKVQKFLPNFGQMVTSKLTNDLGENREFLSAGLFIGVDDNGDFIVGNSGLGKPSQQAQSIFKRKYVDTLNSYQTALMTVGGLDKESARATVMQHIPAERMIGLYTDHYRKLVAQGEGAAELAQSSLGVSDPTATIRPEGERMVEEKTKQMVDGLYGEGTYVQARTTQLQREGYQLQGKTNKGYLRFQDGNGRTKHIRVD